MANKSAAPETTAAPAEELVRIFVPKGYSNDEPNLFIGVNGVNYLLPKGKYSEVPKHIAEEFYRSQKAEEHRDEHAAEMAQAAAGN